MVARQGNWVYYSRRFARKHSFGVGAGAAFILLLSGFAVVATLQSHRIALQAKRVTEERDRAAHPCDVISVYLHAGVELNVCPTARQRLVAHDLAADGADVVLMSHAHVLQPGSALGRTAVAYGLGNFVFAGHSGPTSQTGVLTVDIPKAGPPKQTWHPARIVDGLPAMLTGADARTAAGHWGNLGHGC